MSSTAGARFQQLVEVMRTLRGPDGCPWDREQTLRSLRPFVLEEAYELLDALDRDDLHAIREELGDVLFEVVFLAKIAEDDGHFSVDEIIQGITDKLVRRHPHVFTPAGLPLSEPTSALTAEKVVEKWEDLKALERKKAERPSATTLSGVPRTLPALLRAYELSTRAAAVGFDWIRTDDVIDKIAEEVSELREAVAHAEPQRAEDEMGDLLFTIVNLSRKLGVEPEAALRGAADKFQRRFEDVERRVLADGHTLRARSLEQLEEYWQAVKRSETQASTSSAQGERASELPGSDAR